MAEVKECPIFKGLFVTEKGVILSSFSYKKRIIPARHSGDPKYGHYEVIDFRHPDSGMRHSIYSHRIVFLTHHFIENHEEMQVNHKDLDKLNNHPDNLEWCTVSENTQHAYDTGANDKRKKAGERNPKAKLNWITVGVIRDSLSAGFSCRAVSKYFNMSAQIIQNIKNNKNWVI